MIKIETGTQADKKVDTKQVDPKQPTGDDINKDIKAALDKNRGGPIKEFIDEDGKQMLGSDLERKARLYYENLLKAKDEEKALKPEVMQGTWFTAKDADRALSKVTDNALGPDGIGIALLKNNPELRQKACIELE